MLRLRSFPIALAAGLLAPSLADANQDTIHGTRGGVDMVEREHAIALTFERGHAKLVVRRTVHNGIDRHDEAQLWLTVPSGAVATGVRTLGELDGKPHWFEGELLEAELAAAQYQELTGLGGYYPKDPVLLSWRDPTLLAMQVFPVAPNSDKTIEYTLTIPATWDQGRWTIELPALGTSTQPADVVLHPDQQLDQLFVDGEVVARGHQLELDRPVVLELAPRDPEPVTLALASMPTGSRHLVEFEVSLAAKFSELPRRARIVVALDCSRSQSDAIESERAAAIAYLEHFRDPALAASVAVIGFDRDVHDVTAGFVNAEQAIATLTSANLSARNGSDIERALSRAVDLLAERAPARSAPRILLMTDFLTASRVTPASVQPTVDRSGAIVHLATVLAASESSLSRNDTHAWASTAAATQGVLWDASVGSGDPDRDAMAKQVFEEWARPVRIDELAIRGDGLAAQAEPDLLSWLPEQLSEGEGIAFLDFADQSVRKLTVTGRTWNTPFVQHAAPSAEHGELWSALVFGTDVRDELSEPEMMVLAMRGGAVSPVTSYLAIEPGVRPSTEGIEAWERSGFAIGFGSGSGSMSGAFGGRATPSFDHQSWLASEVGEAWRRCGGAGRTATLAIETTLDEIVELDFGSVRPDPDVEACVKQSIWSLELPSHFHSPFATWAVELD